MTKRTDLSALKKLDLVEFNGAAEHHFVALLKQMILADGGRTSYMQAVQETAYQLDISTETAKRYLLKYTARSAPFEIHDGLISHRKGRGKNAKPTNAAADEGGSQS